MKRHVLLSALLCCIMLSVHAQRTYTFNAVALNVDGLPEQISGVTVNEGAPGAEGATTMGNAIAKQNWDIVAFSEDFDYHNYLVAPLTDYYHIGTWRGKIDLDVWDILGQGSADTDGLGLLVAKRDGTNYTGETYVKWSTYNGYTDQGADGLIKKGFRYYAVSIASGVVIDVYILHMDADSGDKDIAARNAQLTQLATYIKSNKTGRPILIIGDTNCRYTRDAVKTNLIDAINADSRLTIKDVWIEKMWGGEYPVLGAEAMMWYNAPYNNNTGEVVDKIFYINDSQSSLTIEANSYLHNTSFGVSDHYPVIANFTITDNSASAPTDAEKEESWTLEETEATFQKPTWEGEQVVSGTDYYLMNVGTGEYLRVGGAYFTQAVAGNAALKITPTTTNGGTSWVLNTYRGTSLGTGEFAYTDQSGEWYLEPVEGTAYQYRLKNTGGTYLTATIENEHPVKNIAGDANNENQKWVFLTDARIRTEMTKANADYPFNFSALLKSADFDVIEYEDGWTAEGWTGFNQSSGPFKASGHNWGWDAMQYSTYAYASQKATATMSQSIGTLPNGIYDIAFTGFYRSRTSSADETISAEVRFGATSITVSQNATTTIGDFDAACEYFKVTNNAYRTSQQITLSSSSSITVSVIKPESSNTGWICVDNFGLRYYGTSAEAIDPYKEFKTTVLTKVNETYPKVLELNAAGQAAYDISTVTYRYNNGLITSSADALVLCAMVDEAYSNAWEAHKNHIVSQAIADMGTDGDLTAAIINPSFEMGDLTGWTVTEAWDLGAKSTTDITYSISGSDGSYMFNAWSGDDSHTSYVKQTIKGIPNGLYELKAVLASFGTADGKTHDYRIYLTGNDYHNSVTAVGGKTKGQEATLYFLVEDHTATIGAIGGNKGGGSTFIHYWPWEGCFFKADNFRLKRICDVPHGRLKLALDEANSAILDEYGKAALDISSYQTIYDNKSLSGDGTDEAAAVYTALQTAAKAQKTAGADMTWTITNPNFETGDYTGWTCETGGDTKAASQENATYTVAGTDGRFLFNTWNNGTAKSVTQTVSGLTNGTYKLTAMAATDKGKSVTLTGNATSTTIAASTNGASSGVFPEVECKVSDGTLAITVEGADGVWYKCDDFHLTLISPAELVMNETDKVVPTIEHVTYPKVTVNRTIKPNTWSTFVVPFDIPASTLEGWEVKELTGSSLNGENITLTFSDAQEGIKAGVPYMVRNTTMTENLTAITMENADVSTTLIPTETDHVIFTGVYTNGYVPEGTFFISGNKFYRAADASNTMKGFRGYIKVKDSVGATAYSLSYRTDGATDITDATTDNTATIVAIYNTRGMRLGDMQPGINVLRMSNGETVKIIIK